MVIWVTGLAGAGKTTIARRVAQRLRADGRTVVVLDGDELREAIGGSRGYTAMDREALAMDYARLCRLIAAQGVTVVCATISLFHRVHEWNRGHIDGYVEVYVRAPVAVCASRGREQLYEMQAMEPVVGREIPFEEPRQPDLVLENGAETQVDGLVERVLEYVRVRL